MYKTSVYTLVNGNIYICWKFAGRLLNRVNTPLRNGIKRSSKCNRQS